jgi:hypothetical protein
MEHSDPLKLHRDLLYEMHSRLVSHLNGDTEQTGTDMDSPTSETNDQQAEKPDG